ncbi:MAG: STAS-like domain-containing protein [Pseudomonadota bacterium]
MSKTIKVTEQFSKSPFGRYHPTDGPNSGQRFRDEFLAPALKEGEPVVVDLSGYNRYGPSFIDEAFGGLIRKSGIDYKTIENLLTIQHDQDEYYVALAWSRIKKAEKDKK